MLVLQLAVRVRTVRRVLGRLFPPPPCVLFAFHATRLRPCCRTLSLSAAPLPAAAPY